LLYRLIKTGWRRDANNLNNPLNTGDHQERLIFRGTRKIEISFFPALGQKIFQPRKRTGNKKAGFFLRRIKYKFILTTYLLVGISQRKIIGLENYD